MSPCYTNTTVYTTGSITMLHMYTMYRSQAIEATIYASYNDVFMA